MLGGLLRLLANLAALLDRAKARLDDAHAPDDYNVGLNEGPAACQTVPHVHLHLIPCYRGDAPDPRGGVRWVLPARARYWPCPCPRRGRRRWLPVATGSRGWSSTCARAARARTRSACCWRRWTWRALAPWWTTASCTPRRCWSATGASSTPCARRATTRIHGFRSSTSAAAAAARRAEDVSAPGGLGVAHGVASRRGLDGAGPGSRVTSVATGGRRVLLSHTATIAANVPYVRFPSRRCGSRNDH